jgi:hypothetical protein
MREAFPPARRKVSTCSIIARLLGRDYPADGGSASRAARFVATRLTC